MAKNNNIPQGYKDSPLGIIPKDWEVKKLGELGELTSSKRVYVSDYVSEGIPFYRGKEISEIKRGVKILDLLYISAKAYNTFKEKFGVPKKNDILITAVGTLGNILRVRDDKPFYFKDGNLIWMRNITEDSSFLEYLLSYDKKSIENTAIGSSQKALTIVALNKLKLAIPPIKEQQKIAEILSIWDNAIELQTELIAQLETRKRALIQQLLTGKKSLKGFNGKWEEVELGEILDYEQPTNYLVSSTEYSAKYDVPVLTAGKTFILGYTNETTGIYNKILPVIIFDDFTTDTKFVSFPFKAKSSAMKILTPKKNINITYVYAAMQHIKYAVGGHERHWISKYAYLTIMIPSIKEQNAIADILSKVDKEINLTKQKLTILKSQKQGLMQQLLTGKKRIKL